MAEPINLNRRRKAKAAADVKVEAAANRVKFGRTGAQKANDKAAAANALARVDGHKRET